MLGAGAELHLIDPFGRHPDALPSGWGATEWATRRVLARAERRLGASASVHWHVALSHEVAAAGRGAVDLVFIDGDHSEAGCELDWTAGIGSSPSAAASSFTTRAPTAPVGAACQGRRRSSRASAPGRLGADWRIAAEADRTVVFRRL